jgi:hypothetical protein
MVSSLIRRWLVWGGIISFLGGIVGCAGQPAETPARNVNLYQEWDLQPGDNLSGYQVQSGLGDIAIDLKGKPLFMPFDGEIQPEDGNEDLCVILSSPDVPAYLFRICGVRQPKLGVRNQGETIGSGRVVAFAAMRRQADGTWAMVEPAKEMLAQFLDKP